MMDEKSKESKETKESKVVITNEGASTSAEALTVMAVDVERTNNITDDEPEPPDDAICLFCKRRTENKLTKIDAKHDIVIALTLLTIEYEELPSITDYICYQCVYRINVIVDFRRLLERNLKKSRANYYYNIGDKEKCRKYLLSSRNCREETKPFKIISSKSENYTTQSTTNQGSSGDGGGGGGDVQVPKFRISNVRSCAAPTVTSYASTHYESIAQQQDFLFDCFLDIQNQINNETERNSSPILEVMYEDRPQSVLVTESGGGEAGGTIAHNTSSAAAGFFECENCSKTFTRLRFLRKHQRQQHLKNNNNENGNDNKSATTRRSKRRQRQHQSKQKRKKSQDQQQEQQQGQSESQLQQQQKKKQRAAFTYNCRNCNGTFLSLASLKQHQKTTHQKVLECTHCADKFFSHTDWELHEAVCYGKILARDQAGGGGGYQTRSRATSTVGGGGGGGKNRDKSDNRRRNYNEQSENDSDEEVDVNDMLYKEKVRTITEWVDRQMKTQEGGETEDDTVFEIESSVATSFTRESSLSRVSLISGITTSTDNDDDDDDDNDDDDEEEDNDNDAATTSTKRTENSKKRIKIRAKDSVRGRAKRRRNNYYDFDEKPFRILSNPSEFGYPQILSDPHFILPEEKQIFHCPQFGCPYTETCLNRLMDHDIECHDQLPLFYCRICKKRYVRR